MRRIRQAVILAGGQGTRLRPLTLTTPKPMIPIHGKPFLAYLVELLKENGISQIVILVGYLHEQIENYFGDGRTFGISIIYSYSSEESDTGTRLTNALPLLDNTFLLLYGDNYWPLHLNELRAYYIKMKRKALVTVYSNMDHATRNNMAVDEHGMVQTYDRTREKEHLTGVDIGFFILDKQIFQDAPQGNFSFQEVTIPLLIQQQQLAGYMTFHKYYSLSTPDRIPSIEHYFLPRKVVFLDRDGVINEKPASGQYVTNKKRFILLPRVSEALQRIQQKGYEIYIITNQAGIGRGIMTQQEVDVIHDNLTKELKSEGIDIKDVFLCPHAWDEGCFCRKPNPGMFYAAANKYHLNLFDSYCIGDDPRDIIAGSRAGCKTIFLGKNTVSEIKPNLIYKDLFEAANHL